MMDLGDGLAPLCSMFHDTYTEMELEGAVPVLYPIKATGGPAGMGGRDNDSDMVRYAEMQFENRNVQLLISNRNHGLEAYKKYHRIKDDRLDYDIDRPYRKTAELVGQIQNLKKIPTGTSIKEKRISSKIQRDSWSALKYALRLTERLEIQNLVMPEKENEWTKLFKNYEPTKGPISVPGGGRLPERRRGGRLF